MAYVKPRLSRRLGSIEYALVLGFATSVVSLLATELALPAPPSNYASSYSYGISILFISVAVGVAVTASSFVVMEAAWKPDLNVVARILAILYDNGPTKRTLLSSRTGVNYPSFKRYLKWMVVHDYAQLSEDEDGLKVVLTTTGMAAHAFFVTFLEVENSPQFKR